MSKRGKDVLSPIAVPIQRTALSTFDDSFSFLKEKFVAEMKRMDDEMEKFSSNLLKLYGQQEPSGPSGVKGQASGPSETTEQPIWDAVAKSPIIQGKGSERTIKLQFDVSAFDPNDITLEIVNDKLQVYAKHEQKTDNLEYIREMRRQVVLPHGINRSTITASLSRDGVLTVLAPLPNLVAPPLSKVLSKNVDAGSEVKKLAENKQQTAVELKDPEIPSAVTNQVPPNPLIPISSAPASAVPNSVPARGTAGAKSPNRTTKSPSKSKQPAK
ncbi:hypothetical protein O0L34_g3511 [Tuta absoluta]|nr:hypothetical protein O0L34_g3511 [Tuta absoluta]